MKTVVFLTATYPYGKGEEFIENEIEILANKFDKVIIIATTVFAPIDTKRKVPDNVSVLKVEVEAFEETKIVRALKGIKLLIVGKHIERIELLKRKNYEEIKYRLTLEMQCLHIWQKIQESKVLEELASDNITIYSYWLLISARVGVIIKKRSGLSINRMVSRTHGGDLYDERQRFGYLPYRTHFLKEYDKIAPCSKHGEEYLFTKSKEGLYKGKSKKGRMANIAYSYLGTKDYGIKNYDTSDVLYIASCSSVIPVKRVERIATTLKHLPKNCQVCWTHIGSGSSFDILQSATDELPTNVEVNLTGALTNQEVIAYYQKKTVDLFVNVSSSEGLPVSIMEALSFGIPIIATNVGGVSEMVINEKNGYLLERDFTDEELLALIVKFMIHMKNTNQYIQFRKEARKVWERNFDGEKNYNDFFDDISS